MILRPNNYNQSTLPLVNFPLIKWILSLTNLEIKDNWSKKDNQSPIQISELLIVQRESQ